MKKKFRKVPIQSLGGNFYSFEVVSLLWLRFELVSSSLDNNKPSEHRSRVKGMEIFNIHAKKWY
jgi:hypothetical protein